MLLPHAYGGVPLLLIRTMIQKIYRQIIIINIRCIYI